MKNRTSGKLMAMLLVLSMIVSLFPVGAVAATIEPVPGDKTEIVSPDTEPPAEGEVKPSETSPVETTPVETPPAEVPVEKPENALKVEPLAGSATGTLGADGRTILLVNEGHISISATAVTVGGNSVTPNAQGYIIQGTAPNFTVGTRRSTHNNLSVAADTTTTIVLDNVDMGTITLENNENCNVTLLLKGASRVSSWDTVFDDPYGPPYGSDYDTSVRGIIVNGNTGRAAATAPALGAVSTTGAHMTISAIDTTASEGTHTLWTSISAPGHLTIDSGSVTTRGCGGRGEAITAGDLIITGTAVVEAVSGRSAAGIGPHRHGGGSASIRIDGNAKVNVLSGGYSAAIGAHYATTDCGDIWIGGNSHVVAKGRTSAGNLGIDQGSSAIGGCANYGFRGKITITGNANVTATASGSNSAAIGTSDAGSSNAEIIIEGNPVVNATGSGTGAGIEAGKRPDNAPSVIISGGTVNASGGANGGAGIGGSGNREPGKIVIEGGTVTAEGGNNSAGIGGSNGNGGGDIEISGGDITASGGNNGAGIGGGSGGSGGNITIGGGGTINAGGGDNGAGIGGGSGGSGGSIDIGKDVVIGGVTGGNNGAGIGGGNGGGSGSITIDKDNPVLPDKVNPGNGGAAVGGGNGGTANKPEIVVPPQLEDKVDNGTSNVITTEVTLYIDKDNVVIGPNFVSGKDATGTKVTTPTSGTYTITQTNSAVKTNHTITFRGGYGADTADAAKFLTSNKVTLKNVNCGAIIMDAPTAEQIAGFPDGYQTLDLHLEGTNTVAGVANQAGIRVPLQHGSRLNVTAAIGGKLTATGGNNAAGIGGNNGESSGPITIHSGVVNATGGGQAAGIGGGRNGSGKNINILAGTTGTAQGGAWGAGIGGGMNSVTGNTSLTVASGYTALKGTPDHGAENVGNGGTSSMVGGKTELNLADGNIVITAATGNNPRSATVGGAEAGDNPNGYIIVQKVGGVPSTAVTGNTIAIVGGNNTSVDVTIKDLNMNKDFGNVWRTGLIEIRSKIGSTDNFNNITLNLELEGTNNLTQTGRDSNVIMVGGGATLVVTGKGATPEERAQQKLVAHGIGKGNYAVNGWSGQTAVIGICLDGIGGGNMTFQSGTVEVLASNGEIAGIGGANGSRIHITGDAHVTSTMNDGGSNPSTAAAIGGYSGFRGANPPLRVRPVDDIQITIDGDAVVNASAAKNGAAAIGYGTNVQRSNATTPTRGKITIGGNASVTAACDIPANTNANAISEGMGAAIGGSGHVDGDSPAIVIEGNPTIRAINGAAEANKSGGSGIGASQNVRLKISGGDITAVGSAGAAGIGGLGGTIDISGNPTINATGGVAHTGTYSGGAGIGGSGFKLAANTTVTGAINISGSPTIIATGGNGDGGKTGGSGIGKGNGAYSTITIAGTPTITATGGDYGAGIGTGNNSGTLTITATGGKITATGGTASAGMGGISGASGGTINISGAAVLAVTGGENGAGIGGGQGMSNHSVLITGTVTGTIHGGKNAADVGGGVGGTYTGDQDQQSTANPWPAGLTGLGLGGAINTGATVDPKNFATLLIDQGNITLGTKDGAPAIMGKVLVAEGAGFKVEDGGWKISDLTQAGILITTKALAEAGIKDFNTKQLGDVSDGAKQNYTIDLSGVKNTILNPATGLHVPVVLWGVNAKQFTIADGDQLHIAVKGHNRFYGEANKAGIEAPKGSALTIHTYNDGLDTVADLLVEGGANSAGIGGSNAMDAGTIVLESAAKPLDMVVKGGTNAPGIGAGNGSTEHGSFSAGNTKAAAGDDVLITAQVYVGAGAALAIPATAKDIYVDADVMEFNADEKLGGDITGTVALSVPGADMTKVSIELYSTDPADSAVKRSVKAGADGKFTLTGVKQGDYKLVITRPGYTSYTIETVTVGAANIALTSADMVLYAGDLDNSGVVDAVDFGLLVAGDTYGKAMGSAATPIADLDESGVIDAVDVGILISSVNYGKSNITVIQPAG